MKWYYHKHCARAVSGADIENCVVVGNSGSGIALGGGEVINCTIQENGNGFSGGGAMLIGCNISNNSGYGVAVGGTQASIENCLLINNTNGLRLGGYSEHCSLFNCTISGNRGDGVYGSAHYPSCTLNQTDISENQGDGVNLQSGSGQGDFSAYSSNISNNMNGIVVTGLAINVLNSSISNNTYSGVTLGWLNTLELDSSLIENSNYGVYGVGRVIASESVIRNTTFAIWVGSCTL